MSTTLPDGKILQKIKNIEKSVDKYCQRIV